MEDKEYEEEYKHWESIMRTFLLYEDFVLNDVGTRQDHLNRLPNVFANHLPGCFIFYVNSFNISIMSTLLI